MITKRMLILFQVIFLLLFSAIFYNLLDAYHQKEASKRIENALYQNEAVSNFNNKFQKKAVKELQKEGILANDFFNIALMSSSHMSRQVHDEYLNIAQAHGESKIRMKYASTNPLNKLNKATLFEEKLIQRMLANKEDRLREVMQVEKKDMFVYGVLQRNKSKCLQCHGNPEDAPKELRAVYGYSSGFGEKVGDVRALLLLYTPLGFDEDDKNTFFLTVIGFVGGILVLIYITMQYYARELKRKDEFLLQQTQYAMLGNMGRTIMNQWREPLSKMSARVDNMVLDYELDSVQAEDHTKSLNEVSTIIQSFGTSIEKFKTFYDPNETTVCAKPSLIIDEVLQVQRKEFILAGITFTEEYQDNLCMMLQVNKFFMMNMHIIKVFIDLYREYNFEEKVVNISLMKKKNLHIEFTSKNAFPLDVQSKLIEENTSPLAIAKLFITDQLHGEFDLLCSNTMFRITIKLPLEECEE
jgi:two-component system, NtrC family, C4-dicarboxylate transport sensor histidine kinase DctB